MRTTTAAEDRDYLTGLPLEILLSVQSHLPAESKVCLSLLSQRLWFSLGQQDHTDVNRDLYIRQRFLRLLEKDTPHLLLCQTCNVLFNWRTYAKSSFVHNCQHKDQTRISTQDVFAICPEHKPFLITRELINLILRAAVHGQSYGVPLDLLQHQCTSYATKAGSPEIRKSFEPRIIDDRLLLHSSYVLYADGIHQVGHQLETLSDILCPHAAAYVPAVALYTLKHVLKYTVPQRCGELLKCPKCATDVRVRAHRESSQRIAVVLDVWRDLGGRIQEEDHSLTYLLDMLNSRRSEVVQAKRKDLDVVFQNRMFAEVSWTEQGYLQSVFDELQRSGGARSWDGEYACRLMENRF